MQRRVIVLRRDMRFGHEVERVGRRMVEIDAAAAEVLQRGANGVLAAAPLRAGEGLAEKRTARPTPHRLQPRHLQQFERLPKPVEIDMRGLFQFAHRALGQRPQPLGEQPQFQLLPGARARHGVGGARREQRPLPAAVAGPAADAGAANAGLAGDLPIGQRGLLDEPAHRRHLGVAVRPARAGRARAAEGGRAVLGFVGGDAKPDDGIERVGHDGEYNPRWPEMSPPAA